MHTLLQWFCALACLCILGCALPNTPKTYMPEQHALLVGKVDCITNGWFGDFRGKARVALYRLNSDNTRTFMKWLTSTYEATPLEPGLYALSNTIYEVEAGITYVEKGIVSKGKPNYAVLFQKDFHQLTALEQAALVALAAPDSFGVMRLERGERVFFGQATLDRVTTQKRVMFLVQSPSSTPPELAGKVDLQNLKRKEWVGPAFTLGKIRPSRYSDAAGAGKEETRP